MTIPEILTFLESQVWTFAKTMAQWPHEYIVKKALNERDKRTFERLVTYIRTFGRDERFLGTNPVRQYLYVGGWKYWTMGAPLIDTTILNRARVGLHPYDLIDYASLFEDEEAHEEERRLFEMITEFLGEQKKDLLDIGCGDGLFIRGTQYPPHLYTGFDPSIKMLYRFCVENPNYIPRLFLTRAEDYRMTNRFDFIVSLFGTASYIPLLIWTDKILRRSLTPTGRYFLMFFQEDYEPETDKRSGVHIPFFKARIETLKRRFPFVQPWGNYYICSNVDLWQK